MNPFLYCTVAQPLGTDESPVRPARRRLRLPRSSRLSRALRAASLATLAWAGAAGAVDLNTATLEQLRGIRGIGPKTAQIILEERGRGGRYLSFSDLSDRVRGIGPRRALALQSAGLTIDGGGTRLSGQGAQARVAPDPGAVVGGSRTAGAPSAAAPGSSAERARAGATRSRATK